MLKSEPELTFKELALRLGRSRRAVQRWIEAYRRGGIPEMLSPTVRRGRPRRLGAEVIQALRGELDGAGLERLSDVRAYLSRRFGLDLSHSGAWYVLRRDLSATPRGWVTIHDEADRPHHGDRLGAPGVGRSIIEFLNALPTTSIVTDWIVAFRAALATFLGDVDRVSINVDINVDLEDPDETRAGQIVTQHVETTARSRMAITVARGRNERPSDRLLADAARAGFPAHSYHPPVAFDYYHGDSVYIGSIILWRNLMESPVSGATLALMAELEPFILFALSDIVARNKASRPIDTAFSDALRRMNADAELSAQEQRIVILQLMGHSYKEMADMLSVTVDTVKKHFKQIHRKTDTRSQSELFAKYFTFRINE